VYLTWLALLETAVSDNPPDKSTNRPRQPPPPVIDMPDGDPLISRPYFGETKLGGVHDRTMRRYNFETVYVRGHPYIRQNKSLQAIADKAKSRNQPAKRRRSR
jgi:hypothetical protein